MGILSLLDFGKDFFTGWPFIQRECMSEKNAKPPPGADLEKRDLCASSKGRFPSSENWEP